ncbi:MAG: chromophore lyase CpcT/CpeT [Pseudomonadota bacterium]
MNSKAILTQLVAIALALTGTSALAQPPATVLEKDLALMLDWFPGRYDNSLQVFWEPELEVPEDHRHERIHSIFRRVDLPEFGENVFYVEQYGDGDPANIYRQRIYAFTADAEEDAIRLKIYTPTEPDVIVSAFNNTDLLSDLTVADTTTNAGCDVFWRRQSNQFIGYMKEGACRFVSQRSGKEIVITDDLVLTDSEIWIRDKAETVTGEYVFGNKADVHHKLRKIRAFECWVARLRGTKHGDSGEGNNDWSFQSGLWLHDQGGQLQLPGGEDFETDARLILRRMEWPTGSSRSSLVLYAYEGASERAVSYAWAEYDGERIGLNLRWMQASCSHKPELTYQSVEG